MKIIKRNGCLLYTSSLKRQTNTTDERIISLIERPNEEVKQENANKNPTVNSVQRDYMAGEISKDLTARLLRKVVGIVEVDQALVVCLDDLRVRCV